MTFVIIIDLMTAHVLQSSLVSAICIGLNGSPKLLGRATKVLDFIKSDKSEGFIEIELYRHAPKGNVVIKRSFRKVQTASEWRVNGRVVNGDEVNRVVSSFNIKLENLTQFMPQEKVSQFANLGPIDLLKSTQEAVLPVESVAYHKRLIELKKNFLTRQNTIEETRKHLEQLKKKNEVLEIDVERFKRREEHLRTMDKLIARKPFVEFSVQQENAKKLRMDLAHKRQEVAEKEATLRPQKDSIGKLKRKKINVEERHKQLISQIGKIREEVNQKTTMIRRSKDDITVSKASIEHLQRKVGEQQNYRQRVLRDIERFENELSNKRSDEELDNMLSQLESNRRELDRRVNDAQTRIFESREKISAKQREQREIESELQQLRNVRTQRLNFLANRVSNVYKAYQWLQQNKSRFQSEVYCVALDVSPDTDQHANYLEQHCPGWLLKSFVFSNENDKELFMQEMQDQQRIAVNAIYRPPTGLELPQNPMSMDDAKRYNITHFLDQTFSAPPLVKKVISENASVEKVAIGDSRCRVENILNEKPLRVSYIFTPQNFYQGRKSRYSDQVSTRVSSVRNASFFRGQDINKEEELQNKRRIVMDEIDTLKKEYAELETEEKRSNVEREKNRSERAHVSGEKKSRQQLQNKIAMKRRELSEIQKDLDITEEKRKHQQEIRNNIFKMANTIIDINALMRKWHEKTIESTKGPLERVMLESKISEEEEELRVAEASFQSLRMEYSELDNSFRRATDALKEIKNRAMFARREYCTKYNLDSDEEFSTMMLELPSDLEEIEDMIVREKAAANAIYHDPLVIEQYEQRKIEIQQKEEELMELEGELNKVRRHTTLL